MLAYNLGFWTEWYENWKVSFDPYNKYIIINSGVTQIDVQIDLYSVWKRWLTYDDNAKWAAAFRTFGGDETSESQYAPRYFFLINGWKIKADNVLVTVQTNLYSEDQLSPFVINNAAVTNRTSDVGIIKSEIEQRLDYGDRVYYDEGSIYTGTDYPVGTIAQPVNNAIDAITIANQYNIKDFYCLSDVTLPGIVGGSFENYSIYADRENLTATLYGNYMNNIDWHNFTIDGNFSGGTNAFFDCVIENTLDVSGTMKGCQINGTIRVWDSMVMSLCYSGIPGSGAPDFDMNENRPTLLSVRSYSGGVDLYNAEQSGDTATIELIAGQIILNSSCTDGFIDIRGVGYLTDNSSGTTVKTTGFIDSFEEYIESTRELDEQLAYQNTLYYNPIAGFTGITYPIGTSAKPVNNVPHLYYLSEYTTNIKHIQVQESITVSGMTGLLPPGTKLDYFTVSADAPDVEMYIYDDGIAEHVRVVDFKVMVAYMGGLTNDFHGCAIHEMYGAAGTFENCAIYGPHEDNSIQYDHKFRVQENTSLISCYPGEAGSPPSIWLTNTGGTELAVRDWNGDIILDKVENENDRVVIEVVAGKVILTTGCTAGIIDLRGVGYIVDNSSGSTVITTGFVDSFQTYIEETRETDERLAYGDRVYYDETSVYTGTTYPVGTIAQPVNNAVDAVTIAYTYGISKFNVLSDINLSGITGQLFQNFTISGVKENLTANLNYNYPLYNLYSNMLWENFKITGLLSGGTNTVNNCEISYLETFKGILKNSKLVGNITIHGDTDILNCYSGDDLSTQLREIPNVLLEGQGSGVTVDFRNYSGDLKFSKIQHDEDLITIDLNAGKIELTTGCTAGYVEIRGVGYLIDNSGSGCTVNYTGFVDSFQTYIDETRATDQQLAYSNQLYIDQLSGYTGTTYPIGTQYRPVNNIINLFQLSQSLNIKNIRVVGEYLQIYNMPFVADNFNAVSDTPHIPLYIDAISGSRLVNVDVKGFDIIDADFMGNEHTFSYCILRNVRGLAGHLVACNLDAGGDPNDPLYASGGTHIEVYGNTTFVSCHPKHAGDTPQIRLTNPSGTTCAFRDWNGELAIDIMSHDDDEVDVDLGAGQLLINSGCTNGIVNVRGIGVVIDNSSSGCTITRDGQLQASPGEYDKEIVIDVVNGLQGTAYPVGTNSFPVNNLDDALTLLSNYQLSKIRIIGSLTISGGEDVSNISFTAERSVGNNLIITSAVTNLTYVTDLTAIIAQNGSMRYTTSVLVDVDNFDGGAKDCLLVGNINIVGTGSNYFTNCDTYTTDVDSLVTMDVGDKKLNLIRCRGFYKITNKTSTNDITMDLVGGKVEIDSTCVSGQIYIAGICEVIDNSASGCTVIRDSQLQASPYEYNSEIVIDVVNGDPGTLYPIGTNSKPVNNIADAITLLANYELNKIRVVGTLTIDGGEDISGIAFSAERSVGNTLIITSAVTNLTYVTDLTAIVLQNGSMRYTTSVLVDIDDFDGGAKNCLLIGAINIVGTGSNYFTDCDTYTTDTTALVEVDLGDKKLNIIRCRGFYKMTNKTGSNTTTIDMVGGIIEVDSTCTSGTIYIGGICEVTDNSASGCTVINQAISLQNIENTTWDATITDHLDPGSTGNALYNVSAGATPEVIAAAVWSLNITGFTTTGTAGEMMNFVFNASTGSTDTIDTIAADVKRVLGLTQENFRIKDHVYDTDDLLESATISIYNNATDCDNDTSPLAEYSMVALYDSSGRITSYKVTKN